METKWFKEIFMETKWLGVTNPMLPMVVKHQSFCNSFSLIIATPDSWGPKKRNNYKKLQVDLIGKLNILPPRTAKVSLFKEFDSRKSNEAME